MLLLMQALTCSRSSLTAVMSPLMQALTCSQPFDSTDVAIISINAGTHLFTQLSDSSDAAVNAGTHLFTQLFDSSDVGVKAGTHLFTQLFDSSDVAVDAGQVEWCLPVVVLLSWIEARVDQQSHQLRVT